MPIDANLEKFDSMIKESSEKLEGWMNLVGVGKSTVTYYFPDAEKSEIVHEVSYTIRVMEQDEEDKMKAWKKKKANENAQK